MSSTAMPGALEFGPGAVCAAVTAALIVIAICMANWGWVPILNIARYASDARAQELPLVGGGDHDWFNILYRWDALAYDLSIGRTLTVLCWIGLMAVWVAAFWRWQFPK